MRSRAWIVLDCVLLLAIVMVQAWRLTGVPIHEWLGVALIAGVFAHLVLHWPWVVSRSRRMLAPRTLRTRINFSLNTVLLVATAAALISGFAISKVILPLRIDPVTYLKWHGIHAAASRTALIVAGLHLALNWDLMLANLRRFLQTRTRPATTISVRQIVNTALWIAALSLIVGAASLLIERHMALPDITLILPGGKRIEHAAPPADVAQLHGGDSAPTRRGTPALLFNTILFTVACVGGRLLLRLRLE